MLTKRWTRRTKQLTLTALVSVLVTGTAAGAVHFYIGHQWKKEKKLLVHELQIAKDIMGKYRIEGGSVEMSEAWVFRTSLKPGSIVQEEDIESLQLPASLLPSILYADKNDIIGKAVKIEVVPNIPVTTNLLANKEELSNDARWIETSVVQLPIDLQPKEAVDIRIRFPDGQDFVVLDQKWIKKLQQPTIWLQLTEQELLTLSSAYVDAYLNSGQIYAVRYIEPMLQQKAIVNYPVNESVLKLMEKNPNIIEKANRQLSLQSRKVLEQRIQSSQNQNKNVENLQFTDSIPSFNYESNISGDQSPFVGSHHSPDRTSPFVGSASQDGDPLTNNIRITEQTEENVKQQSSTQGHPVPPANQGSDPSIQQNTDAPIDAYGSQAKDAIQEGMDDQRKMKTSK
ncbi:SAF domain-containing protein [Paenibacillus sp. 1001270B_150601_E10]|uniref:SAF domain-containing protein n=1 Tax=Paenibacillus sp. 1001270B_150601_E10 TaxID=2787079 RepID=UPI00189CFBA7|nr:SAF domain-containing protein [Paenibacillus sp. 1001270B_150601_E10]